MPRGANWRSRISAPANYELGGQGRIRLRYEIALEHDKYEWPAGIEEVAYHTDEGLMSTGYALLLAPGDAMQGAIDIRFELPKDWKAITPWQSTGENRFAVPSRRELLNNAMFFGTAPAETLQVGGVELTFVLGKRYRASKDLFVELLSKQMRSYREYFGGDPLSSRYLIIVNQGKDDGGAYASSFSQLISGDATAENRIGWGYVMSHELLHFWNGLSLVRKDSRDEWFNEGFTDYITLVTQANNGLLDQNRFHWRMENIARRYLFARIGQHLGMTVREAGADKQPNRELIYGGGALTGFALDVELRKASDGRIGLPQLIQSMYAEFGKPGLTYSLEDVERHAKALTGRDFREFFAHAVESKDYFDARPWFEDVGLRLDNFLFDESYVRPSPSASAAQKQRFRDIFGTQVAAP
ncbi:hypothetical protein [Arenimonas sp.]|uniref:hypothetical protein n=1 Tax=Arenimonas sp. TaxID=1872635 RepID=UPI0039E4A569